MSDGQVVVASGATEAGVTKIGATSTVKVSPDLVNPVVQAQPLLTFLEGEDGQELERVLGEIGQLGGAEPATEPAAETAAENRGALMRFLVGLFRTDAS